MYFSARQTGRILTKASCVFAVNAAPVIALQDLNSLIKRNRDMPK
jgi:hypothetical protein